MRVWTPSGEDRQGQIDQLKTWLMETADTFIVVQGPRGAGKRELVLNQALNNTPYKLVIDCKPIQEAHGRQLDYRRCSCRGGLSTGLLMDEQHQ